MAGAAKKLGNRGHVSGSTDEIVARYTRIEVQRAAARLYAQGAKRSQIARLLMTHLTPTMNGKPTEQRLSTARAKLRGWERSKKFRDYIWQLGLLKADMEMPQVVDGIMKQAKRGRVDAARLVLEVTGRHNPKGEHGDTTVVVAFGGNVPRPHREIGNGEVIEAEAVEEA